MKTLEIARESTTSYELIRPCEISCPLIIDSPHSWNEYPRGFEPACEREDLLTSWDAWVDELFSAALSVGAPLLSARFPRFFLDLNRARDDIDPALISGKLPFALNPTEKSRKGFGLLRREALPDVNVYSGPISSDLLLEDIKTYYDPYHTKLGQLINHSHQQFGISIHLDCHSMKSRGNAMNEDNGALRPDVVISDSNGKTANSEVTQNVAEQFLKAGLKTWINKPYKGAELITRHSNPEQNRHSVQIELNRALYMDELAFKKSPNFKYLKNVIDTILKYLAKEY